jgi:hypothetical protein
MKIYFAFLVLLISSSLTVLGQTNEQDTLFLKDGSLLVGEIINPDDPQSIRIRTKGGATLYVNTSRVEKMYLIQPRPESPKQSQNTSQPPTIADDRFAFNGSLGLALPTGEFNLPQGAAAGLGYIVTAAMQIRIAESLMWSNRVMYAKNGLREKQLASVNSQYFGVNIINGIYGTWSSWNFQTGLSSIRELDDDFQLVFEGHIGISRIRSPQIILIVDQPPFVLRSDIAKGAGFNTGLDASLIYKNKYQFGIGILRSNPIFTFTSQGQTSTLIQPYRLLTIKFGYVFTAGGGK